MKILSPISRVKEVRPIINSGADELYCGVLSKSWKKNFTNIDSINRRGNLRANLKTYEELKRVVKEAHNSSVPVFLTMNGLYSEYQYPQIFSELEEAKACEVDGFIVADLGFLLKIKDQKLNIHLSTGGTVFNSEDIKFFKKLGVSKITIPRHMGLEEIKRLVQKNKDIEFDVFITNTRCMNVDGFCTFQHNLPELKHKYFGRFLKNSKVGYFVNEWVNNLKLTGYLKSLNVWEVLNDTPACSLDYNVSITEGRQIKEVKANIASIFRTVWSNACGGCAIYDFHEIGVSSLKIVGREHSTSKKIKNLVFLKRLLTYLNENPSKARFHRKAKQEYKRIYQNNCSKNLCYYP